MGHQFGYDWFTQNIPVFEAVHSALHKHTKFLEIGSFEGRSACWMLENSLDDKGTLVCVDNWYGVPEHAADGEVAKNRFDNNIAISRKDAQIVVKMTADSQSGLGMMLNKQEKFDYIYVDGHHSAPLVLSDMCMAFWLLEIGGVMHMDDYEWGLNRDLPTHHPKIAIDAFTTCFKDKIEVIHVGYQYALRRIS
jgi:predicted O-methyltransferase YrrM